MRIAFPPLEEKHVCCVFMSIGVLMDLSGSTMWAKLVTRFIKEY